MQMSPRMPSAFDDKMKELEKETREQRAELEMWRNLHNEMLKNYLENKTA